MSHVDVLMTYTEEFRKQDSSIFTKLESIELYVRWPGVNATMRLIAQQDPQATQEYPAQSSDGAIATLQIPQSEDIHYHAARLLLSYAAKHEVAAHQLNVSAALPTQDKHIDHLHDAIYELSPRQERVLLKASHLAATTAKSAKKLADKAGHRLKDAGHHLKDGAATLSHKLRKSHHDDA